jgi:hypothetical protein
MAHECFEDVEVATAMNELFVNIKVDREERPDVDAVYMDAVQALTGRGGWPMTVFLTPDGRPFYGGTYFPKPSFLQLLAAIDDAWRTRREQVDESAGQLVGRVLVPPVLLGGQSAALAEIANVLRGCKDLDAIHVVVHGRPGDHEVRAATSGWMGGRKAPHALFHSTRRNRLRPDPGKIRPGRWTSHPRPARGWSSPQASSDNSNKCSPVSFPRDNGSI